MFLDFSNGNSVIHCQIVCLCCTSLSHTLSSHSRTLSNHTSSARSTPTHSFWTGNINVICPRDASFCPSYPIVHVRTIGSDQTNRTCPFTTEYSSVASLIYCSPYISLKCLKSEQVQLKVLMWDVLVNNNSITEGWCMYISAFHVLHDFKSSSTFRIQCEAHATALVSVTMVANDNWLYIVGWRCIYLCKYQHNQWLNIAYLIPIFAMSRSCHLNKAGLPSIDWDTTLWLHECIALIIVDLTSFLEARHLKYLFLKDQLRSELELLVHQLASRLSVPVRLWPRENSFSADRHIQNGLV